MSGSNASQLCGSIVKPERETYLNENHNHRKRLENLSQEQVSERAIGLLKIIYDENVRK